MQSQHGVLSALTAAPMHGQYGDALVLLTTTEQAVPFFVLITPPYLPLLPRLSVCAQVCQMSRLLETGNPQDTVYTQT